ncbi:hypothetical protein, partial [Escherichia coli]|uniref:gp53-like domain-containing protein n=1 Tax=Escherichia coli TaxID=562 RepID=UPI0020420EAC
DTKTAQKDKFGAGKNGFTRGNPQTGKPATDLDDDYFDMLQEELCSVVEASGASLDKGRHDQLLTALRALLLSRKNPFGDIKSDGTVKTALENLGLGEAAKRWVGTGENQIPDMSAWTRGGLSTGRWRKSPDGLIEQWGSAGISDAYGNAGVTFPIAFTSAPDFVLFGPRSETVPSRITAIVLNESTLSNTGFTCKCLDQLDGATLPSTSNFYWYCRGY